MTKDEEYIIKNWDLLDEEEKEVLRIVGVSPNNVNGERAIKSPQ